MKIKRLQNGKIYPEKDTGVEISTIFFLVFWFGHMISQWMLVVRGSGWCFTCRVRHINNSLTEMNLEMIPENFTGNPQIVINQTGLEKYWLN